MTIAENFPIIDPSLLLDFANVKKLDPRITFTRAATAVYYDGVTSAKAEENLLVRSQELDQSPWSAIRVSVTANNTTAPDGTNTADKLIEDATASATHVLAQATTATAGRNYTISVFAKASERSFIALGVTSSSQIAGSSAIGAFFDLSAGTVTEITASASSATITNVGNGWYRCAVTQEAAGGTFSPSVYLATSGTTGGQTYTGNGTSGVFLWGAQLEQRDAVTAYTPTTTQAITNYIPVLKTAASGEARFTHDPITGESLGLLIEEARTNLNTYSNFASSWSQTQVSISLAQNVAPDGTVSAVKIVPNAGTGQRGTGLTISGVTAGGSVSTTVYAKAAERSIIQIRWFGGATGISSARANFDLVNGTTFGDATIGISMTNVGNGWWRCTASTAVTGTAGSQDIAIEFCDSLTDIRRPTITADGYGGVFLWGIQTENGAFPTSYIPTVASQVTRAGELAVMTGANFSSWFNYNESTFYAEGATNAVPANLFHYMCSLSLGTSTSAGDFLRMSYAASKVDINIGNTGLYTTMNTATMPTYTLGVAQKQVVALASNDIAASVNGISPVTTTARARVANVDTFTIGAQAGSSTNRSTNGTIKKLAYYPKRLTNTQLQALTA